MSYFKNGVLIEDIEEIDVSSPQTVILTKDDVRLVFIQGTPSDDVVVSLPNATGLKKGRTFTIHNETTKLIMVRKYGEATNIGTVRPNSSMSAVCTSIASVAGAYSTAVETFNDIQEVTDTVASVNSYYVKQKFDVAVESLPISQFDLSHEVVPNSISGFIGRLAIHEGEDFSVSTVGGVSRVTFIGNMAPSGSEAPTSASTFFFNYQYSTGSVSATFGRYKRVLDATDISNGYIYLPNTAKDNSIKSMTGRLGFFQDEDFSVSEVNGVTKITFIGEAAAGGSEALVVGNELYFYYQY